MRLTVMICAPFSPKNFRDFVERPFFIMAMPLLDSSYFYIVGSLSLPSHNDVPPLGIAHCGLASGMHSSASMYQACSF